MAWPWDDEVSVLSLCYSCDLSWHCPSLRVPAEVAGIEPLTLRRWGECSTTAECSTTVLPLFSSYKQTLFLPISFSSGARDSDWTQTIDLEMMRQVFYHWPAIDKLSIDCLQTIQLPPSPINCPRLQSRTFPDKLEKNWLKLILSFPGMKSFKSLEHD